MKHLMQNYAMYFNRKYGTRGHVFDSRYVSCLIEDGRYFLEVSRYIHLNPVKAHMVNNPEDYGWSSYRTMLGISDDKLTARDRTLSYFKGKDVYGYRGFVEERAHKCIVNEKEIRVSIGEDEQWLPW